MRKNGFEGVFLFFTVLILLGLTLWGASPTEAKTWTVTTEEDSAATEGSFRSIVAKAGKGDTIEFLSWGTALTSPLTLDKSLTIQGPAYIRWSGGWEFLNISSGVKVVFDNIKIIDDSSSSSSFKCLENDGELEMKDSELKGKIYIENSTSGTLKMEGCNLLNGGHLFNNGGVASLKNCTLKNQPRGDEGGGIFNRVGKCTLEDCTVTGNNVSGYGGGILNEAEMELKNCVVTNNTSSRNGGGIFNRGNLTLRRTTVTGNSVINGLGAGIYSAVASDMLQIKDKSVIKDNTPDQIWGNYEAESNCTIGDSPNRSAAVFSGYVGEIPPEPRSIVGEEDVKAVASELADPKSALFGIVAEALSGDLHETADEEAVASSQPINVELASVTASLYYANAFEDVGVDADALFVEYTASWPKNVRYYALFSLADGSGYVIPERGVQFELKAGEPLPDGVVPPDFYEEGEGLMTWRNEVADNGPYDHNREVGVVTFRVCSVRAESVQRQGGGGGGCSVGGGSAWTVAMLLFVPFVVFGCGKRRRPAE